MKTANSLRNVPTWALVVLRVRRALLWLLIGALLCVCLALAVVLGLLLFHTCQTQLR